MRELNEREVSGLGRGLKKNYSVLTIYQNLFFIFVVENKNGHIRHFYNKIKNLEKRAFCITTYLIKLNKFINYE